MKSEVIRVRVNPEMKMRLIEVAGITYSNVSDWIKAGILRLLDSVYDESGYPSKLEHFKGVANHVNEIKDERRKERRLRKTNKRTDRKVLSRMAGEVLRWKQQTLPFDGWL